MSASHRNRWRTLVVLAATVATVVSPTAARADQESEVKWNENWPRVHPIEVANIVALTIGSVVIHGTPVAEKSRWNGPILFDDPARSFFKSDDPKAQEFAGDISDRIYHGMVLAPYIIDNYIVALGVHQNADVALQMTLINLQSLGIAGVLSLGAQHGIGRARPYMQDCRENGRDKVGFNTCNTPGDNQSFYSGHAAAAFTMAGLTCIHHERLPLYGGGLPDAMACATMLGLATVTGTMRLVVDRHWASDVVLGTGVGLAAGYLLPAWLHYGFGSKRSKSAMIFKTPFATIVPTPQVQSGGATLGVAGVF